MGWFEEQLEERRAADSKALEDSFHKIAGVVLGQREAEKLGDERIVTKNAIDEILKFYHLKPVEVPDDNASGRVADKGMGAPAVIHFVHFKQRSHLFSSSGLVMRSLLEKKSWRSSSFSISVSYCSQGLP